MGRLAGKTIYVSGAGSGIGQAAALAFANEGANVGLIGRRKDLLDRTVDLIHDRSRSLAIQTDVSDRSQVSSAISQIIARFGRLDCALNNAGTFGPVVPLHEYPAEEFLEVMSVNAAGMMWAMQAQIAQMLSQGSGCIVNTISAGAFRITKDCSAYIAAKNAIAGMTRAAAFEYGGQGIRINLFSPGVTKTPMTGELTEERMRDLAQAIPLGRLGEPKDMVGALVWLLSDEANYVTGTNIVVDGGFSV